MIDAPLKHKSLQGILDFIQHTHSHIKSRKGLYCLKTWREPDGTRIPLEIMNGVRIKSFTVHNDTTIVIHQHSHGTQFKGNSICNFDSTLYLPDMAMVNVYDYSAEFLTNFGIDFVYLEQNQDAKIIGLAEWIHDIPKKLIAQWFKDDKAERMLSGIGIGRKIKLPARRFIDLDPRDPLA